MSFFIVLVRESCKMRFIFFTALIKNQHMVCSMRFKNLCGGYQNNLKLKQTFHPIFTIMKYTDVSHKLSTEKHLSTLGNRQVISVVN